MPLPLDPTPDASAESATGASEHVVTRHRGLLGRAALVSGLTLASRLLGFAREVLSAALFGHQSLLYDAFLTAWRVPNLFRRFFGEGALSTSLTTELTAEDANYGDRRGSALFLATLRLTTWVLAAVCGVSILALFALQPWVLESLDPDLLVKRLATMELTVRVLPFLILICLSALCAGGLNVRGHFLAPALAPVLMNLSWIGALLWIGWRLGDAPEIEQLRFLAWGVLAAGAVQLLSLLPAMRRVGLFEGRGERSNGGGAKRVLLASAPLALGAAAYQINVLIDGLMALEWTERGGVTVHYLANRVQQFPLALIAIAAITSVFPSLKALGQLERLGELRSLHDRTQLGVAFLALPATAGLFALAEPISRALFLHGEFGEEGVQRLAPALATMALALLPAGAVGLTSRAYFSRGDFRRPVRISVFALLLNTALNVLFVVFLQWDVIGLCLATVITSWVNLALLLPGLVAHLGLPAAKGGQWLRLMRMAVAATICGVVAYLSSRGIEGLWGALDARGAAIATAVGSIAGAAAFFLAAQVLGLEEWRSALERVRRKLGR